MPNKSRASSYPEIQEIKEDLDSLRTNVVELTRHIRAEGEDQAHMIAGKALKQLTSLKNGSRREIAKMERRIKSKPAQSLAIAFAVGAVASLLGRRALR